MKKPLTFTILIIVVLVWLDFRVPPIPSRTIEASVVSVSDAPEGDGWRRIVVVLPDGSERTIETLAPFFYRSGYTAFVAVYERTLFPDIYDFVSPPD